MAGYISPATGQLRNADRANLGTLIGAVFFFIGALLLLPERTEEAGDPVPLPGGDSTRDLGGLSGTLTEPLAEPLDGPGS